VVNDVFKAVSLLCAGRRHKEWIGMKSVHPQTPSQISDYLRTLIDKGLFEPGYRLPPEQQLAAQFNISRYQVRDVLRELYDEGYIERIQGKGTFVRFRKYDSVWQFKGLTTHPAREQLPHLNPCSKLTNSYVISPEITIRKHLGLGFIDEAYVLEVTRYIADQPYNYTISYLPKTKLPNLLAVFDGSESLHSVLAQHFGIEPSRNAMTLEAVMPDEADMEHLRMNQPSPLFLFKSLYSCSPAQQPIEYRITKTRGDMCTMNFAFEKE
jgi:GntR family transcriptional regulator